MDVGVLAPLQHNSTSNGHFLLDDLIKRLNSNSIKYSGAAADSKPNSNTRYLGVYRVDSETPWPMKTQAACWHCVHTFDWVPLSMPTKYNINKKLFSVSGIFCSWPCMKAFNLAETRNGQVEKIFSNITLLKKLVTGETKPIPRAPTRYALRFFGGTMDIDTFRNNNWNYETLPFGTIIMPDILHATSRAGGNVVITPAASLRPHTTKHNHHLGGSRSGDDTELSSSNSSPSPKQHTFGKETTTPTTTTTGEDMLDLSTTTSSKNMGSNLRLKRNTPVRRNNKSLFDTMIIRRKEHDGGVNE